MPTLIHVNKKIKKTGKKEKFYYIVENTTEISEGKKKIKRRYLKSLGRVTKSQAYIELDRFINSPDQGLNLDVNILFKDAVIEFENYYKKEVGISIRQRTFDDFLYHKKKLLNFFGSIELIKINLDHIQQFKDENLKGFSASAGNHYLYDLKKVFKYGIEKKWINSIPYFSTFKATTQNTLKRLTEDEIKTVLNHANPNLKFYIEVILNIGLRPKEMKHLKWKHVNFKDRYIHVISDNSQKKGRKIPMTDKVKALLSERLAIINNAIMVSPYKDTDGVNSSMRRLSNKTGVKLDSYKLRKTFASIMAERGVDRGQLALIMGNTIATGEKYYIDVRHEHLREEMKVIESVITKI